MLFLCDDSFDFFGRCCAAHVDEHYAVASLEVGVEIEYVAVVAALRSECVVGVIYLSVDIFYFSVDSFGSAPADTLGDFVGKLWVTGDDQAAVELQACAFEGVATDDGLGGVGIFAVFFIEQAVNVGLRLS